MATSRTKRDSVVMRLSTSSAAKVHEAARITGVDSRAQLDVLVEAGFQALLEQERLRKIAVSALRATGAAGFAVEAAAAALANMDWSEATRAALVAAGGIDEADWLTYKAEATNRGTDRAPGGSCAASAP